MELGQALRGRLVFALGAGELLWRRELRPGLQESNVHGDRPAKYR